MITLSPLGDVVSAQLRVVRGGAANVMIGVAQRTISSTAIPIRPSISSNSQARCSGSRRAP